MSTPEIVETLVAEFNETLRVTGQPDFSLVERCPEEHRQELTSLLNVAFLAYQALAPEREEFEEASEDALERKVG